MMIHKIARLLLVTVISFSAVKAHAQKINLTRPYIGDTVPGIVPLNMMNQESKTFRLSDFKGKWLILDFWASYCQPCVNSMPELYGIQQKFKDDLNILLVTHENADKVKALLKRSPITKALDLPFAVEDTLLKKLFPHRFIPHEVWIDPHGVVRAITDHLAVTSENVRGIISGKINSLPEKKDVLSTISEGDEKDVLYKAILSRILDPNSGRWGIQCDTTSAERWYDQLVYGFYAKGMGALSLFYKGFALAVQGGGLGQVNRNQIIFDLTDTGNYNRYAKILIEDGRTGPHPTQFPYLYWKDRFHYANEMRFDYEYSIPDAVQPKQLGRLILTDLNRYFPIKARIEKRKIPCWILTADKSAAQHLHTKKGSPRKILTPDSLGVKNYPFFVFTQRLATGFKDTPPIVDETGLDGQMMVDIGLHLSDFPGYDSKQGVIVNNPLHFETARRELRKYGLDLIAGERAVPMLVIYDE